jgi:succinyl-CoA synthetase beta subunit
MDIAGGASDEKGAAALRIILQDPQVKTVLINIFGGITRCDEVAIGIKKTLTQIETDVPFIIRLVGTNEKEGREILASANLVTADTLQEAAALAVRKSLEYAHEHFS